VTNRQDRVALVLGTSTGGIGRHVASLAAGLVASGWRVCVYGPAATGEQFDFTATGARFVAVEIPVGSDPRTAAVVSALRKALREQQPNVIHAHGLRAGLVAGWARRPAMLLGGSALAAVPLGPVSKWLAGLRRTPTPTLTPALVVTWHNAVLAGGVGGRALRLAERMVARTADVTLGASADLVARATELGARDARLGEIAAPPLPPSDRDPAELRADLGLAPEQPLILSVGRLHPQKGYGTLIDAAARWRTRTPPPVVVIAGSGPDYLLLASQASEARAPVTLVGHRTDVADLLAAADLAVVTSRWEARQLFAQEALWAGVPLVATAVGGLPDLVADAAVLVPPGDVDAVDRAVTRLLDNPAERAELGERGRRRSLLWPTEAETVRRVGEVYAELVARRTPAVGA
jgi:glycosyltransferase involved in cell wall biosynthesis